jgi:tetratricopeptide (TPR) repeat protein
MLPHLLVQETRAMSEIRLLLVAAGALLWDSAFAAAAQRGPVPPQLPPIQLAASCAAQPTTRCLLADAQVAAMLIKDNRTALPNLAFVAWLQSLTGDRDAALDTLRVGDLRLIGAGPDLLSNYHASVAGVWVVLKDEAKAKAGVDLALQRLDVADEYGRPIALADIGYAQALMGDLAAARDSYTRAGDLARAPAGDPFQIAYVGWNQAFSGDREAASATIREALDALDAKSNPDEWLAPWTLGYAAIAQAVAKDSAAAATRERLQQLLAASPAVSGNIEASLMLAWSYALDGERERAESIVREYLPKAYGTADRNTKVIGLGYAALVLAPDTKVTP